MKNLFIYTMKNRLNNLSKRRYCKAIKFEIKSKCALKTYLENRTEGATYQCQLCGSYQYDYNANCRICNHDNYWYLQTLNIMKVYKKINL